MVSKYNGYVTGVISGFLIAGLIFTIFLPMNIVEKPAIEEKARQYSEFVNTFFKYNGSNVGKTLTEQQLVTEGGVCNHYAEYYANLAQKDGYSSLLVLINYNQTQDHEFAVISDTSGYCILDQTVYWCNKYGKQ